MRQSLTALLCALVLGVAAPAGADVVIERYSRSDGFAGMGGFESTSVTVTAATAQREESKMKFTGGFLAALQKMAGIGDSVRITRLDRDVVWTLEPEKKTYTEQPLTARGERERAARSPGQRPAKKEGEPSDVVVTKNEFKVEKTGAHKVINGFPCDEYLMTWTLETLNQKTKETGKSLMTNHLWTTPESSEIRAAQAEEQAYHQAYVKKLGLAMTPAEAQQFMAGLAGLDEQEREKALAKAAAELRKIQGFTIASDLAWKAEGSGGQAGTRESQPAQGGGQATGQGGGQPAGQGGGQAGGQQDLGQVLSKLFGAGAKPAGSGESTAATGGSGQPQQSGALFNLYTEVKSIHTTGADPARYEVPAGFTKK
jgi:hypothetical protein